MGVPSRAAASTPSCACAFALHRSFFLRHICHDWPDAHAAAILRTVRAAVPRGAEAALLLQEMVLRRQPGVLATRLDLQMLAFFEGKERALAEWDALLGASGFRLVRVHPLRAVNSIIEAAPA